MKKLSEVLEEVWKGLLDRGAGDSIRKEDDIDLLNRDGLYKYIFSIYDLTDDLSLPRKSQASSDYEYFSIPIFKSHNKIYSIDISFKKNKVYKITLLATVKDAGEFIHILNDKYTVITRSDGALNIYEKASSEITNTFCMDVIKTIVENAPEPLLKKKEE